MREKLIKLSITCKEAEQIRDLIGSKLPSLRKKLTEATMSRADKAKRNGKTLGRPPVDNVTKRQIQEALADGMKWKDCKERLGISSTKAYSILKEQ